MIQLILGITLGENIGTNMNKFPIQFQFDDIHQFNNCNQMRDLGFFNKTTKNL